MQQLDSITVSMLSIGDRGVRTGPKAISGSPDRGLSIVFRVAVCSIEYSQLSDFTPSL